MLTKLNCVFNVAFAASSPSVAFRISMIAQISPGFMVHFTVYVLHIYILLLYISR